MNEKWFAFGTLDSSRTIKALRQRFPSSAIVYEADPARLRERVLLEREGAVGVVVGEAGSMDAVNLAAAIVRDGRAKEIVLVANTPTGSLRSRAANAGITKVIAEEDFLIEELEEPEELTGPDGLGDLDEPEEATVLEEPTRAGATNVVSFGSSSSVDESDKGIGIRAEKPAGGSPIICLASGRGGQGKSTLAASMGIVASSWDLNTALVDLDLGSGNLFSFFGLSSPADLSQLCGKTKVSAVDVGDIGLKLNDNLKLWGSISRPELAETLEWRVASCLSELSKNYDLVICDCSTSFTDAVAQAVQMADRLLLVADDENPSPGSMSRAALLAVRLGVARTRIARVLNRCDVRSSVPPVSYRGEPGLETARGFSVYESEDDLADVFGEGRALELAQQDDAFMHSVSGCLASILSELGALPDHETAKNALARANTPAKKGFLSRFRQAS